MPKVDLHLHSIYSDDGQYTPHELVELCIEAGVDTFAIADHNNVRALPEAVKAAKQFSLNLIPAVELDCHYQGRGLHVLAYGIDYLNPAYQQIDENIVRQEKAAKEKRLSLIENLGIVLNRTKIDELATHGVVTGEIMAEVALNDPVNDNNPLLKPYRKKEARSDNPYVNFYWDFVSQGKPGYVEIEIQSLNEAVKLIKETGGIAILAHPGNNLKDHLHLLDGIIENGIQGLEVFSSYHTLKQSEYFLDYCFKRDLLITCGSDFHGKTKPTIKIGSVYNEIVNSSFISAYNKLKKE